MKFTFESEGNSLSKEHFENFEQDYHYRHWDNCARKSDHLVFRDNK